MSTKLRIKINDNVTILSGKDKGKTGKVEKVNAVKGSVLVENINISKKHVKPRNQQAGGIISINKPLNISKVQLVCPSCKKPTKIGYEGEGKGKQRVCKKCSVTIDEIKKEVDIKKTKKK